MPKNTSHPDTSVPPRIGFGKISIKLPRAKWLRVTLGVALLFGSLFWFLPILGLWMLPLGIMVLAVDFPGARRLSNWTASRWGETQGWREKWFGWWRRKPRPGTHKK
jgi:hypothetical protein